MPYRCKETNLSFPKLQKECPYCGDKLFGFMGARDERERLHPEITLEEDLESQSSRLDKLGFRHSLM